ncbi:SigB/SigF/SigG family RNA polymerase sigma factor [Sporosarcina sp. P21c]|uniref:SigF/SigG family RNA polymerase sporulation sigma factor n=1 Tax=Sporosarcina TaxID=1569 RepID=UPI000A16A282|nr:MULTISPECIES: SigF/SigG family RNA polymerase sporulation sigma factor [Sporosarcina]ARJ40154.1 RNA polymerase sigma-F factor [Sporosarcina ureae]PIC68647.1 SigB/SigF/SigG family RNA polymerase sigma factor [Sporosarcina sp. P16a]PIC84579.1 SigB/SigF/SigG family RNA polymerase sigma factor [Sporosarcina sp. P1]PIC91167.1 SigB/SigF/SigG family RNA polymerase sigma factor [Sporosarcina sp. P21c]PIC93700.1 SigB/SigF/SigG family RNA polymerase sigma factor [Sporosarcina sp. P25]
MEASVEKQHALLSQEKMRELIKESQAGDKEARRMMVEGNTRLVWSIVQRFASRGADLEDLFQIGCIGLMKSIDKFDLSYEVKFSTYAVPMIVGEIQRYLRDDGMVKVGRTIRELSYKIRHATDDFFKKNGRSPSISEMAEILEVKQEDIILASDALRDPASLHEQLYESDGDSLTLMDQLRDDRSERVFDHIPLRDVITRLNKRDQTIIYMRYYLDYTQSDIAKRIGISQVQVSRLEKKILAQMKTWMGADAEDALEKARRP